MRAHAQNISGARQHDDKEKIYHKILLLRPKATIVIFFTFVVFCCRNKKMLPKCCSTIKESFLFRKVFSKSLSNVSKSKNVTLVTGGVILGPTMYLHHIWKIFWSQTPKPPKHNPFVKIFSVRVFEKSVKSEMYKNVWRICLKKI